MKEYLERGVNYYETDMMGIVHHSNYIRWFEEARTIWMTDSGIPYNEVEKEGVQIPVIGASCEYKNPAKFGDIISVSTTLKELTGVKMIVGYEVKNKETGLILATGTTKHCFVNSEFRPINLRKFRPEIYAKLSGIK
jgi:acyl-CoA thioester hydrolase, YbgC/YbaW family